MPNFPEKFEIAIGKMTYIGLRLDKPVCDILKELKLLTVNSGCCHFYAVMYGIYLNSFLTSRRVEIYTLLSRVSFHSFIFLFIQVEWGM